METEILFDSTIEEIAQAIHELIDQIKKEGESPLLQSRLNFLYGRFKFSEGKFDEAYNLFQSNSIISIDNGLPENYELGYWVGRISEAKGDYEKAKSVYESALSSCKEHPDNIILQEEIIKAIDRINKFSLN